MGKSRLVGVMTQRNDPLRSRCNDSCESSVKKHPRNPSNHRNAPMRVGWTASRVTPKVVRRGLVPMTRTAHPQFYTFYHRP